MLKEECRIGQHVYFGRKQGAKTLGVIVKLNDKKAKVKTLEQRGNGRGSTAGVPWSVPYSMMFPAPTAGAAVKAEGHKLLPGEKLAYSPFQPQEDIHILQAIACIYSGLSMENLTCDGELRGEAVQRKRMALERKLKGLQEALGRTVSEYDVNEWERERRAAFKVSETED